VPPEAQRFASFTSVQTRRAYENDIGAFMRFTDIQQPEEFRTVTGSHVLAWRADLERSVLQQPAE
jgi:integrase/recombinase XerD